MNKTPLIALAAVILLLTACSSAPGPVPAVKATAAASASAPPGCAKAKPAVAAARARYDANDIAGAATRLRVLSGSLPDGKLKADVIKAALALSLLSFDVATGNPVYQDVKDSQKGFDVIEADCP